MKVRTNKLILFVCQSNSGRSQMAQAFFNHRRQKTKAISAGIKPDREIHPWTIKVMKEVGIDVSRQRTRLLTYKLMEKADKIIIMDSGIRGYLPEKFLSKIMNWHIKQPWGKPIKEVRKIRDSIEKCVNQLFR